MSAVAFVPYCVVIIFKIAALKVFFDVNKDPPVKLGAKWNLLLENLVATEKWLESSFNIQGLFPALPQEKCGQVEHAIKVPNPKTTIPRVP